MLAGASSYRRLLVMLQWNRHHVLLKTQVVCRANKKYADNLAKQDGHSSGARAASSSVMASPRTPATASPATASPAKRRANGSPARRAGKTSGQNKRITPCVPDCGVFATCNVCQRA